jgi:hypothetical protein
MVLHLVNRNRFHVVHRDKLDQILQELDISQKELLDNQIALKAGRLIPAKSIIAGKLIEKTDGIEIVSEMIDTETSVILTTVDVYDEVSDPNALRSLAEGMAIKFHREFPLLDGLIVERDGKNIFTDLGKDKIKMLRRLIVYRDKPLKHPVTGITLGSEKRVLGRAQVTQVMPNLSKAKILYEKPADINPLDKVITE